MALKKGSTRFQGEQLYMLEIFIDRLSLNSEVIDADIENLIFRVKFIDLPEYEIHVPRSDETVNRETADNLDDYKYGNSCFFTKTPSCFIKAIRWSSLAIELHDKDATCTKKNRARLGITKVSLPACMCKNVIAAQKEIDGISTPCTVKDTFNLTNSHGQVSGSVSMVLRLSCFGSPIVEHFALSGKSFMLGDSPMQKFLCSYIDKDKGESKDENDTAKSLLKRPDSPPRIPMNHPAFETLTSAEKMNDPKYRELIYNAYPNEPTCCCYPKDQSSHPMICKSGCTRSCCMKLRNPDILTIDEDENVVNKIDDTYCVDNHASAYRVLNENSTCNNNTRLRGGGDIEQLYADPAGFKWVDYDGEYTWYDERHNYESRLVGGGGEEKDMSSCSCSGSPVPLRKSSSKDRDVISVFNACAPRVTSIGPSPGCACPGKDAAKMPRGAAKCTNKPCQGIDCLIRAFKDAQEFVDSIGKVPGLPGLGLMDPAESPYFGRDIDKDYVSAEPAMEKKKTATGSPPTAAGPTTPVCTAPCGMQGPTPMDEARSPFGSPIPRGTTVPPRLGIVREAIPVLPEAGSTITHAKHKKKEEKKEEKTDKQKEQDAASSVLMDAEVGPCGEPKCKSKRIKSPDNISVTHSVTSTPSRTRAGVKRATSQKVRRKGKQTKSVPKQQLKKQNSKPSGAGPGGDRGDRGNRGDRGDRGGAQSPIAVSKRVMQYVYFVGDYYPGIHYGHKNCIDIRMRVPANMGWLWNTMATTGKLKRRIGWRPGAIGRYLYELLQNAKENSFSEEEPERSRDRGKGATDRGKAGTDRGRGVIDRGRDRQRMGADRARSTPSRQKSMNRRSRSGRAMSYQGMQKQSKMEGEEQGMESPPTLHIHRKDGTYYVTMYPIRQETSKEPRLSEPIKPLQFKIVKNKEDASDASSSTASDMEIEFSPPAAVSRYRKKPNVIHVDTQVRQHEILDAFKAEELKKKGRRSRREKKMKQASRVSVRK